MKHFSRLQTLLLALFFMLSALPSLGFSEDNLQPQNPESDAPSTAPSTDFINQAAHLPQAASAIDNGMPTSVKFLEQGGLVANTAENTSSSPVNRSPVRTRIQHKPLNMASLSDEPEKPSKDLTFKFSMQRPGEEVSQKTEDPSSLADPLNFEKIQESVSPSGNEEEPHLESLVKPLSSSSLPRYFKRVLKNTDL